MPAYNSLQRLARGSPEGTESSRQVWGLGQAPTLVRFAILNLGAG